MRKIEATSPSGWRVQIRVSEDRGTYLVSAAVHINALLLSPFFDVARFDDVVASDRYAQGLKSALEDS